MPNQGHNSWQKTRVSSWGEVKREGGLPCENVGDAPSQ